MVSGQGGPKTPASFVQVVRPGPKEGPRTLRPRRRSGRCCGRSNTTRARAAWPSWARDPTQHPHHVRSSLRAKAQHDEARPLVGIVLSDVSEAEVEGQENALLGAANISQARVFGTP